MQGRTGLEDEEQEDASGAYFWEDGRMGAPRAVLGERSGVEKERSLQGHSSLWIVWETWFWEQGWDNVGAGKHCPEIVWGTL